MSIFPNFQMIKRFYLFNMTAQRLTANDILFLNIIFCQNVQIYLELISKHLSKSGLKVVLIIFLKMNFD